MKDDVELNEIMTDGVIAIEKDESILEASKELRKEGIRGLVVVDDGEAVGVIVCRDITYQVVASQRDPEETSVEEIMSTDLIVAEEDEVLNDVAMAMAKNNISRVPVVRGDMLVGILTQSDILRAWPGFAEIIGEEMERDHNTVNEQVDEDTPDSFDDELEDEDY